MTSSQSYLHFGLALWKTLFLVPSAQIILKKFVCLPYNFRTVHQNYLSLYMFNINTCLYFIDRTLEITGNTIWGRGAAARTRALYIGWTLLITELEGIHINQFWIDSKHHSVQLQGLRLQSSCLMALLTEAVLIRDPLHVFSWGSRCKQNGDALGRNLKEATELACLRSPSREFHSCGLRTAKAQSPFVMRWLNGAAHFSWLYIKLNILSYFVWAEL